MSLNSLFLEQNCDQVLKTCNFNGAAGENCASEFCFGFPSTSGTCPQIGLDPKNCCGSSDPASCLYTWVHGNAGISQDNPCASVVGIILDCSSSSPTLFPSGTIYTSGPGATALASCMCYDNDGTYDPNVLDGFASSCVASGSSAHPTYYPYASRLLGFCTNVAGPAGAAASTTAPLASSSNAAVSTTAAVASSSAASAVSTTSQQTPATSATPIATSSAPQSSSAAGATNPPASTATTKSSGAVKNTFQAAAVLLLGFNILLSLY